MFIDEVKKIARENKPKYSIDNYRNKIKRIMLKNAEKGFEYCKVWLPYDLDLEKLNEILVEDGIECLFLESNLNNTKYKVYVSERIDYDEFIEKVRRNRNRRK